MEKIIDGVYKDGGTYYIDGKKIGGLSDVSNYLYASLTNLTNNPTCESWEHAIKKRRYIELASKELGFSVESVIPRKIISCWLKYLNFYEDFKYSCSNYDKIRGTEYLYWFFGRGFVSQKDIDRSLAVSYPEVLKEKQNKSYIRLCSDIGFRSDDEIEKPTLIMCTYKGKKYASKTQLREALGIPKAKLLRYQRNGYTFEEAVELCVKEKSRKNEKQLEWYNLLKQREGSNSSVELKSGIIQITIEGVHYSVTDVLKKYNVSSTVFRDRIEKGLTIYESLTLKRNVYVGRESFSFLGKTYKNYHSFYEYYNISSSMSAQLVRENSIEDLEKTFLRLFGLIKKSGVENFREMGYLLIISKRLECEEDIIYQIQNYDKLDDNCFFYLGGKSYRSLGDFYKDYNIRKSYYIGRLIFSERIPLYKVAEMLNGYHIPKISSESPSTYLYIYFKDYILGVNKDKGYSDTLTSLRIDNIRKMLAKDYSVEEVKDLLDTYNYLVDSLYSSSKHPEIRYRNFIFKYMGGILSREGLEKIFNDERILPSRDKLLQYSNVKIIKRSYKVKDIQYFLCKMEDKLEYLSGSELIDIAIESVKELRLSNKEV